jgi:hypothetical protein
MQGTTNIEPDTTHQVLADLADVWMRATCGLENMLGLSTEEVLMTCAYLERRGLVEEIKTRAAPLWEITPKGRQRLQDLDWQAAGRA